VAPEERGVDLAVLVHEFPKLSETFVLHDLLALEQAGVRLRIFSLRRPEAPVTHDAVRALRAEVHYLPEIDGRRRRLAIRATRTLLALRNPKTFMRGMAAVYASPDYSKLRVNQALLLAGQLEAIGAPPLYIHFAHRPATVGRFASLLLGNHFAISAHAVDVWTPSAKELRAKVRDARVVLCCYEESRAYLARLGRGSTPVELVYHGVAVPEAVPSHDDGDPVVLAVGRLVPKKGYPTLIEAAGLLRERGIEASFRIAGDGPEWPSLQRLVNERGLGDTVHFLGPLTDTEIGREYERATVFSLACQEMPDGNRDGIPNTVVEAMARGLAVASTTLPSVAEAVEDGVHGLLVPQRDAAALAAALERLLGDRALRESMGAAGRRRVEERFDRAMCGPRIPAVLRGAGLIPSG
jgi:glycosyltransferase involved in cell wall biosynthesis